MFGKSHIKVIRIKTHSNEWHQFRKNGIGGSEIGGVLGYNKYSPAIYLYHAKVGDISAQIRDNQPMFHGRQMEDYVARCWAAYGGTEESLFENYGKRIVRRPKRINGYIVNKKYPLLFASPDRIFSGFRIDTTEEIEWGILECKTISFYEAQKWEHGIPPSYLFQVQQYMLVMELDYAELACLKNGNEFVLYPIERNEAMCNMILEESERFWARVKPAQEAFNDYISGKITYETAEIVIQKHEPNPDESERAQELLSERYKKVFDDAVASDEDEEYAAKLVELKSKIKEATSQRDLIENYFRKRFVDIKSERLLMSNGEYIRASKRANAQKLTITV